MKNKIAAGIVAGLLAATALIGVVAVAYDAGRDDRAVRVVDNGEAVTRVVAYSGRGWHGPGFIGLVIPVLLIVGVIVFLTRRHGWGGRHRYGGWGPGPWGGPYGPGGGWAAPGPGDPAAPGTGPAEAPPAPPPATTL